jgi:peptidoglycan/LPS O-acetylase OafA/YrhL
MTLGERLVGAGSRPSGFDYMRVILALAVIAEHTLGLCYGPGAQDLIWGTFWRWPLAMVLPMFFALSGFLVAGSLERSRTIVSFLGLRLFRLVPALAMETVLSALVLGPIFTTLTLSAYFGHPEFAHYFLNIVGDVHFSLPGVFDNLPLAGIVNLQLWTLPWELMCYLVISVFAISTMSRRPWLFAGLVMLIELSQVFWRTFLNTAPHGITVGGPALVISFLFGISLYVLRNRLPWDRRVFLIMLALCVLVGCRSSTTYLLPLPAAYVTAFLGLTNPPRSKWLLSGDYSYGLYLYGFPIQQAIIATLAVGRIWWVNMILAWIGAGAMACFSWWVVERPVHERRKVIFHFETWLTGHFEKIPLAGSLASINPRTLLDSRA